VELSLAEYLDACRDNPALYATPTECLPVATGELRVPEKRKADKLTTRSESALTPCAPATLGFAGLVARGQLANPASSVAGPRRVDSARIWRRCLVEMRQPP
jgi:hypothetical protein